MRLFTLLLALACFMFSSAAYAQQNFDMRSFENMPIADQGRIKPLSSFAENLLKDLSGKRHLKNLSATQWLAATVFDPPSAAHMPVIAVETPELVSKLGLPKKGLYSYAALKPGLNSTIPDIKTILEKEPKDLTAPEKALLDLHKKAALMDQLMRSFSAYLPLDITLSKEFRNKLEGPLNYKNLLQIENSVTEAVKKIVAQKGPDPKNYTPEEVALAQAAFHIEAVRAGGRDNALLRIIPVQSPPAQSTWQTPWEVLQNNDDDPATGFILSQWLDLANAFRSNNAGLWDAAGAELLDETLTQSQGQANLLRFKAERFYKASRLYIWAMVFYGLGFLSIFAKNIKPAIKTKLPFIYAGLGILTHVTAIALRIYILDRPPVGTLYESVLFVSLVCVGAGLCIAHLRKSPLFLAGGLAAAVILLFVSPFLQTRQDSLEVLVAVLNTNFWLGTHVLGITAGYGLCILAAGAAHAALYLKAKNAEAKTWMMLQQNAYHLSLAALLFTAVGTILGGIWADQSWGRFWGWDPKENGALLIVLWLIWAQHGRQAQKLGPNAFLAVMAALNIIVALSWFGVNLLSVGLHSYGFTSGLAGGLALFCTLQTAVILWLYTAAKKEPA